MRDGRPSASRAFCMQRSKRRAVGGIRRGVCDGHRRARGVRERHRHLRGTTRRQCGQRRVGDHGGGSLRRKVCHGNRRGIVCDGTPQRVGSCAQQRGRARRCERFSVDAAADPCGDLQGVLQRPCGHQPWCCDTHHGRSPGRSLEAVAVHAAHADMVGARGQSTGLQPGDLHGNARVGHQVVEGRVVGELHVPRGDRRSRRGPVDPYKVSHRRARTGSVGQDKASRGGLPCGRPGQRSWGRRAMAWVRPAAKALGNGDRHAVCP